MMPVGFPGKAFLVYPKVENGPSQTHKRFLNVTAACRQSPRNNLSDQHRVKDNVKTLAIQNTHPHMLCARHTV